MKYLEKYPEIYGVAKRQLVFNCMYHYQKGLRFLSGSDLKTLKSKVKAIYKDISIDKNDIKEYTKKDPLVAKLYEWVTDQFDNGRITMISDAEMEEQIATLCEAQDL